MGPTVAPIYPKHGCPGRWFAVSIIVPADRLLTAIDHLRSVNSSGITVATPEYMFEQRAEAFVALEAAVASYRPGGAARW